MSVDVVMSAEIVLKNTKLMHIDGLVQDCSKSIANKLALSHRYAGSTVQIGVWYVGF